MNAAQFLRRTTHLSAHCANQCRAPVRYRSPGRGAARSNRQNASVDVTCENSVKSMLVSARSRAPASRAARVGTNKRYIAKIRAVNHRRLDANLTHEPDGARGDNAAVAQGHVGQVYEPLYRSFACDAAAGVVTIGGPGLK